MKYNIEIGKDAHSLLEDLIIKVGDVVAITFDTELEQEIAHKVAEAVNCKGAKPIMICVSSYDKEGKAYNNYAAIENLSQIMLEADIWIELGNQ